MIDKILTYLNFSWVGTSLTIVTFFLALIGGYYFYRKGQPKKSLDTYSDNFLIIDRSKADSPENIEIFFLGKKVEKLHKTLIYMWNSGNQIVKSEDLKTIDRLKISTEESAKILSVNIVKSTRDVINFSLMKNNEEYEVNFDYLDPTDGVVIEILHTGEPENLTFSGTVMGILQRIGSIDKNYKNKFILKIVNSMAQSIQKLGEPEDRNGRLGLLFATIGSSVIALGAYGMINSAIWIKWLESPQLKPGWSLVIAGLLYLILGIYTIYNRPPYPKNLRVKKSEQS
ncbi:MAG: hypothetical protein AB8U91_05275 [Candidatus Midichloria sp.]